MSTIAPLPRRNRLLSSCAVAAIAALSVHAPVRAQVAPIPGGFQGTVQPGSSGATVTTPTPTSTNTLVTVDAPRAIINWTPNDNRTGTSEAIDFLPADRTANFVNNSDRFGQDYIVLNRILPTDQSRVVAFNGSVRSTLSTVASGAQGGQVWFYNPGGILVGATGSFDVGSLLLTANDLNDQNGFLSGASNSFAFNAVANSRAAVEVQGTINALGTNAYVALVAPRVVQSGNVTANGSAAYVAAEAATMTISGSLFDIQVDTGSSVGGSGSSDAALVHDGTTTIDSANPNETGYGPTPATARHAILVAVPKNDAVTMLVQGNIEYTAAARAEVVDKRIILSAGHDVNGGFIGGRSAAPANSSADIRITNQPGRSAFDIDVVGQATGVASATAIARNETGDGGVPLDDLAFGGSLSLTGARGASLEAGAGSRIDIGGQLELDASGSDSASNARASLIARTGSDIDIGTSALVFANLEPSGGGDAINARTAEILVQGGSVDIANLALVEANARGGSGSDLGGDAAAGTAIVSLTGGSLNVGDLAVQADGRGGDGFGGEGGSGIGGDGFGGIATVEATGGTLTVAGDLGLSAGARGGFGALRGGNAEGGEALLRASGTGRIDVAGFASVEADAGDFSFFGGEGGASDITGGDALAGSASVEAIGGGTLGLGQDLAISATGAGGFGGVTGGNGEGGGANIVASGGSIGIAGTLSLISDAIGGRASSSDAVRSGDGQGGASTLTVGAGASLSAGTVVMSATGLGGIGFQCCQEALLAAAVEDVRPGVGGGGNGSGGTITATIGGSLTTSQMILDAVGIGGDGRSALGGMDATGGSDGAGGDVVVEFSASTSIDSLSIDVDGIGGEGGFGSDGGDGADGGNGIAGSITLRSTAGDTTIGSLSISAEGIGGEGGFGAFGGEGGGGSGGNGGIGRGGDLILEASGAGTLSATSSQYDVSGFGGDGGEGGNTFASEADGGDGGNGGEGVGGTIRLTASEDGTLNIVPPDDGYGTTFFPPEFRAEGHGGDGGRGGYGANGGSGGAGGTGRGGGILIDVMGGTLDFAPGISDPVVTALRLLAEGYGGDGGDGNKGGDEIDLTGIGGDGGRGGDAFGGSTSIAVTDGSLRLGGVELFSGAQAGHGGSGGEGEEGGDGGRGGDAFGGAASFSLTGAASFEQLGGGLLLQAYGLAGNGGDGAAGLITGGVSGSGGDGIGGGGMGPEGAIAGGITINLSADDVTISDITARVKGDGGLGGNGIFGNGNIAAGEGVAAEGGAGGSGTGGTITLTSNQGVNRILSRIKFSANGEGGTGGLSDSLAGGAGGKGLGGGIKVSATDTGELILAGATLNAYGLGGAGNNGGDNDVGGNGGRGGDATGGAIRVATLRQGRLTLEAGEGGGDIQANVYAIGGSAGSGGDGFDVGDTGGRGGDGGDAAAGRFDIEVDGGTATLGNVNADANARSGAGGGGGTGAGQDAIPDNPQTPEDESQPAIPATGAPGGSGGFSTGGTIRIDVADHEGGDAGILIGRTFNLSASAFDGSGESVFGSAGTIGIFEGAAAESGSLQLDNLFVEVLGFGDANPLGFELVTDTGRIDVLGTVDIFVDTDASLTGIGDGRLVVGDTFGVRSNGGSIALAQDAGAEVFLIEARDVNLSATGSIDGASAGIFASEDVRAQAGGDVGLGVVEAGDDILITGGSATIGLARTNDTGDEDDGGEGGDEEPFGSNLVVNTSGSIFVAEADVADEIRLTSSFASVESNVGLTAGGEVSIDAATDVRLADATAGDDVDIDAGRNVTSTGTLIAGDDVRVDAGGDISLANARADDRIALDGDDVSLTGEARAGNLIDVEGDTVSLGDLFTTNPEFGGESASTGIAIRANGAASVRSADSASIITVDAGDFSSGALMAGAFIDVATFGGEGGSGAIDIASAEAGSFIQLRGDTTIDAGSLTAGTDIDATTGGNVVIASATAGDDIFVASEDGAVSVASATTIGEFDTESGYGGNAGSNIVVEALNDARLDNGTTPGEIRITSFEGNVRSSGLLDARRLDASSAIDIAINNVLVDESLFLETENGSVSGRNFDSGGGISLFASGAVAAGRLTADSVEIDAAGAVSVGSIQAMTGVEVESASEITLGSVLAGADISVDGAGDVTTGNMSGANVQATALGRLTAAGVMARSGALSLSGGTGTLQTGALLAMTTIDLDAQGGTLQTGSIESLTSTIDISTTGDMTLGNVRAGGSIFLTGGGRITTGSLVAGTLPPGSAASGGTTGLATALEIAMAGIAPGFDDFAFARNDDGATGAIATPFSLNFFGEVYEQLFVSNNGYITFNSGQGTFTPSGLGEGYNGQPIIAAFFADVDTRNSASALMTYGPGDYAGRPAFGATWDGVGYFPSAADKLNNFQIVLTDRTDTGAGNFDIFFNYTRISWETGSASGGSNGFGGVSAAVGYNAGTGNQPGTFFELPGSRVPGSFLDGGPMALITTTNNGVPGQLQFQVRNGQVNPGGGTGGSFGTGDIRVTNTAPGNTADITLGSLAARDIEVTGAGAVTTGAIDANRDVLLTAAGALTYAASEADGKTTLAGLSIDGGVTVAGTDLIANGGIITIAEARAGDDITIRADETALIGAVTTTGQGLDGEEDGFRIDIEAAGDVTFGEADAIGDLRLVSREGGILRLNAPEMPSGNVIDAGGNVFMSAAEDLALDAVTAGGGITLASGSSIDAERLEAAGAVSLTAQNGTVLVSQDLISGQPVTAIGRAVTLNAVGNLSVGSATATAGNVALVSGGGLSLGNADASGNVMANSGGTLGLTGAINGTQISLSSRDIAVGSSAQVGTIQRTTGIQITANGGTAPVVIGGSASGAGYRLDGAEFSRLAGRDISISAQGEAGTMQIDALTVRGAAASNPNVTGRLSFSAAGNVEMTGRLAFDTATDANSVRVSSGGTFFADAAGAGIAVTNGTALTGSIDIDADAIIVASRTAQTDLASLTDTDARNDRLGQNDGTEDSAGFLRAGGIRLSASDRIHVQNSGLNSDEPNDRAGLSAGAGGITLVTNSTSTPVEIIINGRQVDPAGGEFTGEALIDQLTIVGVEGGEANFAERSTVNGCLILGTNCGVVILPESPLTFAKDVIQELVEEDEEEGEESGQPPRVGFNRLIEMEGSPFVPVIDEPVTGSGNEDLTIGGFGGFTEDELNRQSGVDQPVTGTGNETLQTQPAPLIQLPPPQPQGQQPDATGPVTGTGNETLQSTPPRDD